MQLEEIGWHPYFEACFVEHRGEGVYPARVMREDRGMYRVIGESGEVDAYLSPKKSFASASGQTRPTTGDWVAVKSIAGGTNRIEAMLPRRTAFIRQSGGPDTNAQPQVVATNIDTIFVVAALDGSRNFNLRGIERYLTLSWNSGAKPVLLLNKSDLCADIERSREEAESVARGVDIHSLSALSENVSEILEPYIRRGQTITLVGPSGVGKSSLINRLSGTSARKIGDVREGDMKGRHTTTWKEMVFLPSGAVLIDTPGMRSIGLWGDMDGVSDAFPDVMEVAAGCRFRDCSHTTEPGCAVREAVESGDLDEDRVMSYIQQTRELSGVYRQQREKFLMEAKASYKRMKRFYEKSDKYGDK